MRIRNFRSEDIAALFPIQQHSAQADGRAALSEDDFVNWLTDPAIDAPANVFVITDDDDELNTWGQAGTLEGIEGEIVGYTLVQLYEAPDAYHLLCRGTVDPQHRRRHAGRALLICALNRARILAAEFEFEAEQAGLPIYFAALLPVNDPNAPYLAAKCEMQPAGCMDEFRIYRREL